MFGILLKQLNCSCMASPGVPGNSSDGNMIPVRDGVLKKLVVREKTVRRPMQGWVIEHQTRSQSWTNPIGFSGQGAEKMKERENLEKFVAVQVFEDLFITIKFWRRHQRYIDERIPASSHDPDWITRKLRYDFIT